MLKGEHVVLVGPGGIGKSSISKAVLNDDNIVTTFPGRLFITYDGLASSAMTFQAFLDRIADALDISTSNQKDILQRLRTLRALLVIDNAETFLEASPADMASITEMLDAIGEIPGVNVLMTTRNPQTAPPNLNCLEIIVPGLPIDAASQAFGAVYTLHPIDDTIRSILKDLDYHPLSINILANTAKMNRWSPTRLEQAWSEGQSRVLDSEVTDSKYRNLRVSIELSLHCPILRKSQEATLMLLRTIALLPQGIHEIDLPGIALQSGNTGNLADLLCQCSLVYWVGSRLTALSPIRMFITDTHNQQLPYNDKLCATLRTHYYGNLSFKAHDFVEREHANLDRLLYIDMTSSLYRSDNETHRFVLDKADNFLFCTSFPETSLWPLLVSETQGRRSSQVDPLALLVSKCMNNICWVEAKRGNYTAALIKLDVTQDHCRQRAPACDEQLGRCLRLKGNIFRNRGNLLSATTLLEEASSIAISLKEHREEALLDCTLGGVLLLQGNVTKAKSLFISAQKYLESNNEHSHLPDLLIYRAHMANYQNESTNARLFLAKATEIDSTYSSSRQYLEIVCQKASCEGWSGEIAAALKTLENATEVEVTSTMAPFDHYVDAIRGKAYYEARIGNLDKARKLITRVSELNSTIDAKWNDYYVLACVVLFSSDTSTALALIQVVLNIYPGSDKQWSAIYYRTIGEIMLLESKDLEAKGWFEQAKSICDAMGMFPRHLCINMCHWYSLPTKYNGWSQFLDGTL